MTPFVIAEFAGCHDGSLERMLEGVHIAKDAGADAFKTWWCSSAERVCERMHAPEMLATYRLGQFPQESLGVIANVVHSLGLELLVTVDCPEDIASIAPYVDRFKIASWGATDEAFIEAHLAYDKPVIVSVGTLNDDELALVNAQFLTDDRVALLHCVSGYPAPLDEVNLAVIANYLLDGWSDHTASTLTGALAVCAGAQILEVHFRLDTTRPDNADFAASLAPGQLRSYIYLARRAAVAMGDATKRCQRSEETNKRHRYR